MILGYFTGDEFLEYLSLIGGFLGVFYPVLNKFLDRIKVLSAEEINKALSKFNNFYVFSTFTKILLFGLSLILGIALDVLNLGLTHEYHFKIYFLIVQSGLGLYSGNLISSIFDYINKVFEIKLELAKYQDKNH